MKRLFISIVIAAFAANLSAQTVNIHFKNGQTIVFPSENVEYVDFSEKAPDPTVSAGAVVDLGLSVYWSSCNVGAESPEESGDYYAWGETSPKSNYTKEEYAFYNNSTKEYIDIGDNISGTVYDAATVNLGSDWRMPTEEQVKELLDNCTWEWTQIKNINGYKVTGKNGNSIFIPAAGLYSSTIYLYKGEKVCYNTSSESTYDKASKVSLTSTSSAKPSVGDGWSKFFGFTIRPVTSNPNAEGGPVDHSQDYLVTDKITASYTGGSIMSINGNVRSGSVLNFSFNNGSSESVKLIEAQLYESSSTDYGNNLLNAEVDVAGGESKGYSFTLNKSMTTPVVRFTYRYNKKKYTVEATYKSVL